MQNLVKYPIRFLFASLLIALLVACQNKEVSNSKLDSEGAIELSDEQTEANQAEGIKEELSEKPTALWTSENEKKETGSKTSELPGSLVYKNTKHGFQFNYPKQVAIQEMGDEVKINFLIAEGVMESWSLKAYSHQNKNESLSQWFKMNFDSENNKDCNEMASSITITGANTVLLSADSMEQSCEAGGHYTMSPNGNTIIQWNLGQDSQYSKDIINSFQFI